MKKMKNLITVLSIVLSLNGFSQQKELIWHTDVNKAINISIQQDKPLFLFFTGSDWCGWCKRLVAEVFEKDAFKQNRELGQMFGVRGYPTGWFVIPESDSGNINFKKLGSQGYVRGGPKAWITGANQILKNN